MTWEQGGREQVRFVVQAMSLELHHHGAWDKHGVDVECDSYVEYNETHPQKICAKTRLYSESAHHHHHHPHHLHCSQSPTTGRFSLLLSKEDLQSANHPTENQSAPDKPCLPADDIHFASPSQPSTHAPINPPNAPKITDSGDALGT
jgi:hypothetical protein